MDMIYLNFLSYIYNFFHNSDFIDTVMKYTIWWFQVVLQDQTICTKCTS